MQLLLEQEDGTKKGWRQSLSDAAEYYDEQRQYLANLLTNTKGYDSLIRYMTETHFNALMDRIRGVSDPSGPDGKTEMLVRLYGFGTVIHAQGPGVALLGQEGKAEKMMALQRKGRYDIMMIYLLNNYRVYAVVSEV